MQRLTEYAVREAFRDPENHGFLVSFMVENITHELAVALDIYNKEG